MLLTTLFNIAIFQGIILGFVILRSPLFKSKANTYLALAIFGLSIALLNLVLEIEEVYEIIPLLLFLDNIEFAFVIPVFLHFYVVNLIDPSVSCTKKYGWLYTPFIYSAIVNIINDLGEVAHLFQVTPDFKAIMVILQLCELPLIILFIPFISIETYRYIKQTNDKQKKKWLTYLWFLIALLFNSWLLSLLIGITFEIMLEDVMRVLALFTVFLIHSVAYFGIYRFRLAKDQEAIRELIHKKHLVTKSSDLVGIDEVQQEEEKKSSVKEEVLTEENPYFKKLEALCKHQHIYRDSTLDRNKIADELGISAGYVSQLINSITGKNFSSYINVYRVEAVKEMILDSEFDNYSLLAIGLECGFSSKTTFHNSFKKITGMTPNAYRKLNK